MKELFERLQTAMSSKAISVLLCLAFALKEKASWKCAVVKKKDMVSQFCLPWFIMLL